MILEKAPGVTLWDSWNLTIRKVIGVKKHLRRQGRVCGKNFSEGPTLMYKDISHFLDILDIFMIQKANKSIPQTDKYSFFASFLEIVRH